MCDYSLHHVASRPAKVRDKLVTTELARSSTRGFAAVGERGAKLVIHDSPPKVAVCLLPGTELAFDDDVRYDRAFSLLGATALSDIATHSMLGGQHGEESKDEDEVSGKEDGA